MTTDLAQCYSQFVVQVKAGGACIMFLFTVVYCLFTDHRQ